MKSAYGVQTARPTVDIVVVTYNNLGMLDRCLSSIFQNTAEPIRLIVVNNGDNKFELPNSVGIVLNIGKNLGWTEGVNAGVAWALKNNPAPFVMWMNDDTQVLPHDYGWLTKMINCFHLDSKIGAVGPTSNAIMGLQSTNHVHLPPAIATAALSGMCVLTKKEIAEEIGPLDQCSLKSPGDDLDFCMRLSDKGYKICVCTRSFLLHHASTTGKREHGDHWNSQQQSEEINTWLIKKHGFKKWFACYNNLLPGNPGWDFVLAEEEMARKEILPAIDTGGMVLDLGCGGKKIHGKAIGVDLRESGCLGVGPNATTPSAANVQADILKLPFSDGEVEAVLAKHLLEHIMEPLKALREWKRVLKDEGKLVIICPDYRYCEAIACDPSHVHAFTPESVVALLEEVGFEAVKTENVRPGYVFMIVAQKSKVKELEHAWTKPAEVVQA